MDLTQWLKNEGWVVLEETGDLLRIEATPQRMTQEADQLFRDLQDNFGLVFDPAQKVEDGTAASIRAVYDPATGRAILEIMAVD